MENSKRKVLFLVLFFVVVGEMFVSNACLITNCPRGGKRAGKYGMVDGNVKPCISCGPGRSGQCFGPNICCGPFGCLMGSAETLRCHREGQFQDREPCVAGSSACRKNTGRCAFEGICCDQESCHSDKQCSLEERKLASESLNPLDLYSIVNYPAEFNLDK